MLAVEKDLWPSSCRLNSNGSGFHVRFNGTYGGQSCHGTLGDVDPDTCTTSTTLVIRSPSCPSLSYKGACHSLRDCVFFLLFLGELGCV